MSNNTYEGMLREIVTQTTALVTAGGTETAQSVLAVAELVKHTTQLTAQEATLDAILAQQVADALARNTGVPAGGVPFTSINAAAVALAATPVEIVAQPAAGIAIHVTAVHFSNITNAEVAVLLLQDEDDVAVFGPIVVGDPAVTGKGQYSAFFKKPIILTTAKALEIACVGNVGDSYATVEGYTMAPLTP